MPDLNPQDQAVLQEIWSNNLSLVQVWQSYKLLNLSQNCTFSAAITMFLENLESNSRSARYVKEFRWVLARVDKHLPDGLTLYQSTTKCLWSALETAGLGETGRRKVGVFLNWCYREKLIPTPVLVPGKPSYPAGEVRTLSNPQVTSLLQACPPPLLGHLWLCLCMGLRVAEAIRVADLECRDGYLIVGAKASKTRTRRVITMLEGHGKYWKMVEPQVNLRRRLTALKKSAGIQDWPRNAMRHTAASHWLNYYQDENKAALHLGHSPAILHRHYKALVTQKESEEFFCLW